MLTEPLRTHPLPAKKKKHESNPLQGLEDVEYTLVVNNKLGRFSHVQ